MKNTIKIFSFILAVSSTTIFGQSLRGRMTFGKEYAKLQVKKATSDSSKYNICDKKKLLLQDKKSAIAFAENYLFVDWDKEHIISQRPYEIYLIDNYWFIKGTISKDAVGGTFTLIINAINKEIIGEKHTK